MANEKTPVVWDDDAKKHRPLGSGEKMGGLSASSMISSDSGNLLQQGSDGLMLVTGSSLADPRADNLLEESDSGKLQVTSDRIVEWLDGHPQAAAAIADAVKVVSEDSGNVIVQGSDKGAFMSKEVLTSAVSEMTPAQMSALADALRKAGGGLNVDPATGKLVVDFGSMDPAIMRGVVLSMVQQGGGIAVDGNGQIYVDFDSMPTAKFESLLKSLKMQIPLSGDLQLFVDGAGGSDAIIEGRGTEALPFKTIQACVTYATQNYAVGAYTIFIRVKPGTYVENITFPQMTRTSGGIQLRAFDFGNPPVIRNNGPLGETCSVIGDGWSFNVLDVVCDRQGASDGLEHFPSVFNVFGGSASLSACRIVDSFSGAASSSGHVYMRTFEIGSGGSLSFFTSGVRKNSITVNKGAANSLEVFLVSQNSSVTFYGSNTSASEAEVESSGEFSIYATVSVNSSFSYMGGTLYLSHIVVPSGATATGKPYSVSTTSGISLGTYSLPGDVAGTVDSSTYGWYQGA